MLIVNVLLGPGEQLGDSGRGRGVPSTLGHIRGPSQGQKIRVWTVRFTKDTKILAWTVKRQDSCVDSKTPRFLRGQLNAKILAWTVKCQDSCVDSKTPRILWGQ